MKHLTWKLVLPLTVISFVSFTKWWYVLPVDATDTMMYGFPLAFMADSWHTSMSYQFFISEFISDLAIYFLFWLLLVFIIDRFIQKITFSKILTTLLLTTSGLIVVASIFLGSMPEHIYMLKRDFDYELMTSGPKYIWKWQPRPDLNKYKTEEKK